MEININNATTTAKWPLKDPKGPVRFDEDLTDSGSVSYCQICPCSGHNNDTELIWLSE